MCDRKYFYRVKVRVGKSRLGLRLGSRLGLESRLGSRLGSGLGSGQTLTLRFAFLARVLPF